MLARVTGDGYAVFIGDDPVVHPVYQTQSFVLLAELPLTPEEAALYVELIQHDSGVVRLHIRSALAQLGVDAFHPTSLSMQLEDGLLKIETLITSFNGDMGMRVINDMRELIHKGEMPRIMHAGLLPHTARVQSGTEVEKLCKEGSLKIDNADIYADGSIGLPPQGAVYHFREQACTHDAICSILLGEGRATLASLREEECELPELIFSGDFLVTGVDLHTKDHHVVLRRETLEGDRTSSVIHGESCVLHAGRTRGGTRQLELWNAHGRTQKVPALRVVADLYRASAVAEPGH